MFCGFAGARLAFEDISEWNQNTRLNKACIDQERDPVMTGRPSGQRGHQRGHRQALRGGLRRPAAAEVPAFRQRAEPGSLKRLRPIPDRDREIVWVLTRSSLMPEALATTPPILVSLWWIGRGTAKERRRMPIPNGDGMPLVEHDDVIEGVATAGAHPPLRDRILPGAAMSRSVGIGAHRFDQPDYRPVVERSGM